MTTESKLLVVDDEQVVCDSCARIFEHQGYDVQTSTSPMQALKMALQTDYDAILLDMRMPEMDGLEFMDELRRKERRTPVIIITGYSSVPNATAAMRLGAVDFIPKPFTPDEITGAVARVVPQPAAVPAAAAAPALPSLEYRFLDEAWARADADGSVKVGAFLTTHEAHAVEAVRLPRVGDPLERGLPLAAFALEGGVTRIVPSPVTGQVVEVHADLRERPGRGWAEPCLDGWLARVRPDAAAIDLGRSAPRSALVLSSDAARGGHLRDALARLGCTVRLVPGIDAALAEIRRAPARLIVVDGRAYGSAGPALVGRLNDTDEAAKVAVLDAGDAGLEAAYRRRRILYYGVGPVQAPELLDLTASAFRAAEPSEPAALAAGPLPTEVHAVRITNRQGRRVSLIAPGAALRENEGLGRLLIESLARDGYPLDVALGPRPLTARDLDAEAARADRVVVLAPTDLGRLAGSLVREAGCDAADTALEHPERVSTLKVQTGSSPRGPLAFEPRTLHALAGLLARELASA